MPHWLVSVLPLKKNLSSLSLSPLSLSLSLLSLSLSLSLSLLFLSLSLVACVHFVGRYWQNISESMTRGQSLRVWLSWVHWCLNSISFGDLFSDFDPCLHMSFCFCQMVEDDFCVAEWNCLNELEDIIFLHGRVQVVVAQGGKLLWSCERTAVATTDGIPGPWGSLLFVTCRIFLMLWSVSVQTATTSGEGFEWPPWIFSLMKGCVLAVFGTQSSAANDI